MFNGVHLALFVRDDDTAMAVSYCTLVNKLNTV